MTAGSTPVGKPGTPASLAAAGSIAGATLTWPPVASADHYRLLLLNYAGNALLTTIPTCKAGSTTEPSGCSPLATLGSDLQLVVPAAALGGAGAFRFQVQAVDANGTPGDPTSIAPPVTSAAVTAGDPGAPQWAASNPVVAGVGTAALSWTLLPHHAGMALSYFLQLYHATSGSPAGARIPLTPQPQTSGGTGLNLTLDPNLPPNPDPNSTSNITSNGSFVFFNPTALTATAAIAPAGTYQYELVVVATYSDGTTSPGTPSARTAPVRSRECGAGQALASRQCCGNVAAASRALPWRPTMCPTAPAAAALADAPTQVVAQGSDYLGGSVRLAFTSKDATPGGSPPPYTIAFEAQAFDAAGSALPGTFAVTPGWWYPQTVVPAALRKYKVRAVATVSGAGTVNGPWSDMSDPAVPIGACLPAAARLRVTWALPVSRLPSRRGAG